MFNPRACGISPLKLLDAKMSFLRFLIRVISAGTSLLTVKIGINRFGVVACPAGDRSV
jgi:hypothetical protein